MRLSLRRRLFVAMVGLGTLPLAGALLVLALQVRSTVSPEGPRAALEEIAESGRALLTTVDTTVLDEASVSALQRHAEVIQRRTQLARRADVLTRVAAGVLGVVILIVSLALLLVSLGLARRWSRFVSQPIEELVDWVGRVERRAPLPASSAAGAAVEFDQLRSAVRSMASALDHARTQELERERLRAFRETARRVAHEMRGPLSAARLALRQLSDRDDGTAVAVLNEETERLALMAEEFSEFGRLPEGAESDIDLRELVESLVGATVPPGMPCSVTVAAQLLVTGHYEPLRRALQNVIRNAIEATDQRGIRVDASEAGHQIVVRVTDYGPGIDAELRDRVFEPYFTTKKGGTGLGLAMVRQIVADHGGSVQVEDSEAGGATFVLRLSKTS